MTLTDIALGQNDVVALDTPNGDFVLVEFHPALAAAFFCDHDCEHRSVSPLHRWARTGFRRVPRIRPFNDLGRGPSSLISLQNRSRPPFLEVEAPWALPVSTGVNSPRMQIKAQGLLNGAEWVLETHGQAALASVLGLCGPVVRERYMTAIAIEWHDGAELEEFLHAAEQELGGMPGSVARAIGAAGARHNMKGFMRRLAFYVSRRDYALARVAAAWRQFNDEGEMSLEMAASGVCSMQVTGAELPGPLFCETLTGWCAILGEHVGMRNPRVGHETCRSRGHEGCTWKLRWEPGRVTP